MYLAEFDFNAYGDDKQLLDVDTSSVGPPWIARWVKFFTSAVKARGGNVDVPVYLYDWIRQHPDLEDVTYQMEWIPASPFMQGDDPETARLRWIGEQGREDVSVRA